MEAEERDGQRDFDFFIGSWKVHNRRLRDRLKGSTTWDEFDGTVVARALWGGNANMDEYEAVSPSGPIQGMTVRLYDPKSRQWSLYWETPASGALEKPMIGGFHEGRGEFYDQEMFEGRSIYAPRQADGLVAEFRGVRRSGPRHRGLLSGASCPKH